MCPSSQATAPGAFTHPGAVRTLRESEAITAHAQHARMQGGGGVDPGGAPGQAWQYPLREFHLKEQAALAFPHYLGVSNNFYNPNWRGLRRLKNVVVVMEWAPSAAVLHPQSGSAVPPPVCAADSEAVVKSLRMLAAGDHADLAQGDAAALLAALTAAPLVRTTVLVI